jgi:ubiquinone/menaquinone biosynthesis C-methylase UbiE
MIDSSPNMLEIARKNILNKKLVDRIIVRQADGKNLPFENNSFAAIVCSNMLHHIKDPLDLLKEMKRVVTDGGVVVIRDIVRPSSKFLLNIMVSLVGLFHDRLMKKEYSDSLYASFTINEFKEVIKYSGIKGLYIRRNLVDLMSGYVTLVKES